MASTGIGSSTITIWKRRSSALSFSKNFWYSSSVVAPIERSSPRDSAGFRMFAASIAPSLFPAPTSVCISSMKRMISPSDEVTSLTTPFRRSSNSPLYFAPAISAPISSEYICFDFRFSGTSPFTIRWAMPSAMAVFPTPGSPTRMGLFFVRRDRICSTRRISSSRPITGSSLPERAWSFRLMANRSSALKVSSADWLSTVAPLRSSLMAAIRSFSLTPLSLSSFATLSPTSRIPRRMFSTDTYWSPSFFE